MTKIGSNLTLYKSGGEMKIEQYIKSPLVQGIESQEKLTQTQFSPLTSTSLLLPRLPFTNLL